MKTARSLGLIACLVVAASGCKKKEDAANKPAAPTAQPAKPGMSAGSGGAVGSGATTGSATSDADGIQLPNMPAKVGDKRSKVEDLTMTMQFEAQPGQKVDVVTTKHEEESQEVLAADGAMITKLKISYGPRVEKQTAAGKTKDKASPLVGKTYLVWREGGKLQATREDGSAPEAEELAAVLKSNRKVGRPDPMDAVIAAKRWKNGVRVDFTDAELKQLNDAREPDSEEPIARALALTLLASDPATATFEMSTSLQIKTPKGELAISMTGKVLVERATGRQTHIDMTGPLTGNMGMPVTGTMHGKTTFTY